MRQQIDLFQEVLIEKKPLLQAGLVFALLGGVVLLLFSGSILSLLQQRDLQNEVAELEKTRSALAAELSLLDVQTPQRQKDPLLQKELEKKQLELINRRPIMTYIEQNQARMVPGFSAILKGLARYPYQDVWLTGISLNAQEDQVRLAGSATRADLIPTYLKHLSDKQVLKGQTFASLKLVRLKETERQIDFRLESVFGAADEK